MQCFHSPKQSERNTKNRGRMCCANKGGYSGLLQACAIILIKQLIACTNKKSIKA